MHQKLIQNAFAGPAGGAYSASPDLLARFGARIREGRMEEDRATVFKCH